MANPSMDRDLVSWLRQQLQEARPDLLREMLATMVQELMGAEAQQLCGAEYGERSSERSNSRNRYREREWDTRAGTIELAVPKLRRGSYFPDWLLEPRRRAERALGTVIARPTWPVFPRDESRGWSRPWASPTSPSRRSRSWPRAWTAWSMSSGTGPWTAVPTPTSGSTP